MRTIDVEVGVQADISRTLDALAAATSTRFQLGASGEKIRRLLAEELSRGAADDSFPLKPQRIVADTRAALDRSDIVLADTGAVKMWMARLLSHLRAEHLPGLQWAVDHGLRPARRHRAPNWRRPDAGFWPPSGTEHSS